MTRVDIKGLEKALAYIKEQYPDAKTIYITDESTSRVYLHCTEYSDDEIAVGSDGYAMVTTKARKYL